MSPTEIVLHFIDAVNSKDLEGLSALMTADHLFVDSLGRKIPGRDAMRRAWQGFFAVVPDYHIEVAQVFTDDSTVLVVGQASGTFSKDGCLSPANRWQVPAAWKAEVSGGSIREWHAFVDNEPLRRIMLHCGGEVRSS